MELILSLAKVNTKKEFLFKLLAVSFGISISFLILFALDYFLDSRTSALVKTYINRNSELALHLKTYLVPSNVVNIFPKETSIDEDFLFRSLDVNSFQTRQMKKHRDRTEIAIKTLQEGSEKPLLEIQYTIDKQWRRLSAGHSKTPRSEIAIVYIGCSFTWGEGVQDNETFISNMEKKLPNLDHINLGLPSVGLNDIYAQIGLDNYHIEHLRNDFDPKTRYLQLPYKKIILVYLFIADHLYRAQCSQRCYNANDSIVRAKPYFQVKGEELIFEGLHRDRYSSKHFPKLLSNSSLFNLYNINFPSLTTNTNIKRHHLFLKRIKEIYSRHFEVLDSYAIYSVFDDYEYVNQIEDDSFERLFTPIIFDRMNLFSYYGIGPLVVPFDGHPSPLMNKITAEALTWRISKDHSKLTN